MTVGVTRHEHVRGQRWKAGGHLPDVQVVDLDGRRRAPIISSPDLLGVEAARRGLEEDPAGVAQQAVGGAQHHRGDEERGDRVSALAAGQQDRRARDRGAR